MNDKAMAQQEHESELIGESPALQSVIRAARMVAATDVTSLILGESGTGKELLARMVHRHSPRAGAAFVAVNCAALPDNLAEAELFGHRRGAFTGAVNDRAGHLAAAHGGTLFLDEVGELSLAVQAKLLRVLECGEYQPLGQTACVKADIRLLAATHRDLFQEVKAGRFREDLFYRLHVIPLELPPLRERSGDLALLLEHLTAQLAARHQLRPPRYSAEALAALNRYDWPGNVRELRNFCERMLILCSGQQLGIENLPREILDSGDSRGGFQLPASGVALVDLETGLIRQALQRSAGNRSHAARLLGLSRDTLLYRLKKYAIE